jgi:hypothetical protein
MNSYGLVPGGEATSHDSGNDIMYNVDTKQGDINVIIEGDEFIIPVEVMNDDKEFDFENEIPIDILFTLIESKKIHRQFPNLKEGDMVICKNSVRNEQPITIKGTAKEIANYLQALSSCRLYKNGGKITPKNNEVFYQQIEISPMPYPKPKKSGFESLQKLVSKERDSLSGVFMSNDDEMVATNAIALVLLKNQKIDKNEKGKIWAIDKQKNKVQVHATFPNYKMLIDIKTKYPSGFFDMDYLLDFLYGAEVRKVAYKKEHGEKIFVVPLAYGAKIQMYNTSLLYSVLYALKSNGAKKISLSYYLTQNQFAALRIDSDNGHIGLLMPIFFEEYNYDGEIVTQEYYVLMNEEKQKEKSKEIMSFLEKLTTHEK